MRFDMNSTFVPVCLNYNETYRNTHHVINLITCGFIFYSENSAKNNAVLIITFACTEALDRGWQSS